MFTLEGWRFFRQGIYHLEMATPHDRLEQNAPPLAALGEPVRRALYRFVTAGTEPVSREQAASGVDVAPHTAKFHLDKLVEEGLLDVEYRRLTGRSGPGAGRPAKLYRRAEREFSLSLPERRYDLVGQILAEAVEESTSRDQPVARLATEVARRHGEARGRTATAQTDASLDGLAVVLEGCGYEPVPEEDGLALDNCPFDRMAKEHTALVCGLNVEYVDGIAAGLGCQDLVVELAPSPGRCCVRVRER